MLTLPHHVEFLSDDWLAEAGRFLEQETRVRKERLGGRAFSVSERFADAPPHLKVAGDVAGYPNGRRPIDDVFDISLRAIEGILVSSTKFGLPLGDGVNTKTEGFNNSFPYVMPANNGRDSAHTGPGQAGCTGQPGGICPVK